MTDIQFRVVPVAEIDLAPWNYKKDDKAMMAKIVQSIKTDGYISKIIVAKKEEEPENDRYEAVDGNHRLVALREAGLEFATAIYVGRIPLAQRKRIGVELNEIKFKTNILRMAVNLEDMAKDFTRESISEALPFSIEDLRNYSEMLKADWVGPDAGGGTNAAPIEPDKPATILFQFGKHNAKIKNETYLLFKEAVRKSKAGTTEQKIEQALLTIATKKREGKNV